MAATCSSAAAPVVRTSRFGDICARNTSGCPACQPGFGLTCGLVAFNSFTHTRVCTFTRTRSGQLRIRAPSRSHIVQQHIELHPLQRLVPASPSSSPHPPIRCVLNPPLPLTPRPNPWSSLSSASPQILPLQLCPRPHHPRSHRALGNPHRNRHLARGHLLNRAEHQAASARNSSGKRSISRRSNSRSPCPTRLLPPQTRRPAANSRPASSSRPSVPTLAAAPPHPAPPATPSAPETPFSSPPCGSQAVGAVELQQRLLHRVLGVLHTAQQSMRHAEHEPRLPLRHLRKPQVPLGRVYVRTVVERSASRKLHHFTPNIPSQRLNRKPHRAFNLGALHTPKTTAGSNSFNFLSPGRIADSWRLKAVSIH